MQSRKPALEEAERRLQTAFQHLLENDVPSESTTEVARGKTQLIKGKDDLLTAWKDVYDLRTAHKKALEDDLKLLNRYKDPSVRTRLDDLQQEFDALETDDAQNPSELNFKKDLSFWKPKYDALKANETDKNLYKTHGVYKSRLIKSYKELIKAFVEVKETTDDEDSQEALVAREDIIRTLMPYDVPTIEDDDLEGLLHQLNTVKSRYETYLQKSQESDKTQPGPIFKMSGKQRVRDDVLNAYDSAKKNRSLYRKLVWTNKDTFMDMANKLSDGERKTRLIQEFNAHHTNVVEIESQFKR